MLLTDRGGGAQPKRARAVTDLGGNASTPSLRVHFDGFDTIAPLEEVSEERGDSDDSEPDLEAAQPPTDHAAGGAAAQLESLFELFDADGDGLLSQARPAATPRLGLYGAHS